MRLTSKGQVTIPLRIREATGILPGCEVDFDVRGKTVVIRKSATAALRGEQIVQHLRGRGNIRMTTDEIMALTRGD